MRFRVLSYNIHRAIGVDRRFRPERVARILGDHDPDLALLQEVDEGVPRSRELDLARELAEMAGYPHVAVGHNVHLRRGRYGNATLSRHPIVSERNIDLTIGIRKRRGCQHTALSVTSSAGRERRVEVFNLHMGLSARERKQQVGLLLGAPEFTDMLGFRCATDQPGRPGRPILTYPAFFPRGGLDRMYYRGRLRLVSARTCRLRLSRVASDHLPIVADFELH